MTKIMNVSEKEEDAGQKPMNNKETENKDGPSALEVISFTANTTIFDEGDPGDAAYIIRSGRVEIRKGTHGSDPVKLAELGKGDVLGELALFDGRPRMASAVALTDVTAIRMSREDFLDRLSTMDTAMKGIVLTMVSRVRKMSDEFMRRKGEVNWSNWNK